MNTQTDHWGDQADSREIATSEMDLMKKLPMLLRILGAGAVIIAMYSFLAKGWQSGNDVFRYMMMLGHTGLLTAIAVASGHWLKESKGARLLLTLALVSVPANFAILGAFIFSRLEAVDINLYPHYVAWSVDSLQTALLVSGGAMLVLVPVTLLAFAVLARSLSKKLSLLFLFSNMALLLPLRDPHHIGLLVSVLAVLTLFFSRKAAHSSTAAKTQDGVTALGLQLLPLGVLMGRSLWLYSFDLFLMTVLAATVFLILRQVSLYLKSGSTTRNVMDGIALVPAVSIALLLSNALYDTGLFATTLILPLGALVSSTMVYDISRRSTSGAAFYRHIATAILLAGTLGNLVLFSGALATLICTMLGFGTMLFGYRVQQRGIFAGGVLMLSVGLIDQLYNLFRYFDLGSWASMALFGIASIVVASLIESKRICIRPRIEAWREQFRQWEK